MLPLVEAAALLVGAGALLAGLAGTLHAARWARPPRTPPGAARPFATVVVPCRGEHPGFEANVRALVGQAYGPHDVLFVTDSAGAEDPCARALARLHLPAHARVLETDEAIAAEGWATGKIAAQLTGAARADPRSRVLVFADADARPAPGWLAALVAPLEDQHVGGVTGYRWYRAATRPTFWTALRDAWNAVGLDAMTMPRYRFLWGGSMAVRRADFERSDVRARWRTTVSEDVGLTRAVRALGLRLAFAPEAVVESAEDWSRAEVLEWVVRQSALTRGGLPDLFRFAAWVYALGLALLAVGLALAAAWPTAWLGSAGLLMLVPTLSALPRAWLRERMVRAVLPAARAQPARERALQLALSLALPPFTLWALAKARRLRAITWRGRTYELPGARAELAGGVASVAPKVPP